MGISKNAQVVLERRYLIKDKDGNTIETVDEMFHRVADAIASSEKMYENGEDAGKLAEVFYDMMTKLEFLPNSPTLMNAGKDLGQLSA